ncbi:MAG: hypothetical protein Fur0016_09690 [Anaerolineales bacterium]
MAQTANIRVEGNVEGSIVVGDNNFVVNANYGTMIYKQAAPQVRLRQFAPQPPRAPHGFVDRSVELAKLEDWIASNEIVLIHAPDGMGKSALLHQAARSEAAKAMPNGVILLEPPGFESQALGPDDVCQLLFDALFESDPPMKVNSVTARTYLSNTRPLVVLDEVPLPPMLQRSLPDLVPQGAFLLSADLPTGGDFQRLPLGPLPRDEAAQMLAARAEVAPSETLKYICGLLEDVSLAVIITGNLMRETGMTPEETLNALGKIPVGGADPIAIALDRAYTLVLNKLDDAERKVLSAAALTPGVSMSPGWFSVVLGANVDAAIERLEALGLLYANSPRLRLPPGFRLVARRQSLLNEAVVFPKLVSYLLEGAKQGQDFIAAELGNFLGALDWAVRAERLADVIALARTLAPFLCLRGLWDVWSRVLDFALHAAVRLGDRAAEAWALHENGVRLVGLGNLSQANELFRRALNLRQKLGDEVSEAYTRHNLEFLFPETRPAHRASRFHPAGKILLTLLGLLLAVVILYWVSVTDPFSPTPTPTSTAIATQTLTQTPTATPTRLPTVTTTADVSAPQVGAIQVEPSLSFYGPGATVCSLPGGVVVSLEAFDPAGIASAEARYRYWSGSIYGEWYQADMTRKENDRFVLQIDHNEQERALRSLDGQDGELEWEATVRDRFGNAVTLLGPVAVINYSRCEANPPVILRPAARPNPIYYGDVALCGGMYPTQMEISALVQDESVLKQVFVQYYYRRGASKGPVYTLPLGQWGNALYGSLLDHNNNNLAAKTLKEKEGFFVWQIIAVDEFDNRAESNEMSVPIEYRYCPPPG